MTLSLHVVYLSSLPEGVRYLVRKSLKAQVLQRGILSLDVFLEKA